MKKFFFTLVGIIFLTGVKAQEISVGLDFYNRYIFRGIDLGNSPSLQPSLELNAGGLTMGAWGAYSTANGTQGAYNEVDLYLCYTFDFGFSLGLVSYYSPELSLFEFDKGFSSHAVEINGAYTFKNLSFSANYVINDSREGIGSKGGDTYFEIGYTTGIINLFMGGGDGWNTKEGNFQLCNCGIGVSKELKLSDSFSLPLKGALIMNPNTEKLYLLVGLSFKI